MKITVKVISDSSESFDFVHEAGITPRPIPEGKNTLVTHFITKERRAAVLVQQKGFKQTKKERIRGEECNGLSVAIADTADLRLGKIALDELLKVLEGRNE